jgi:hypothetical protein
MIVERTQWDGQPARIKLIAESAEDVRFIDELDEQFEASTHRPEPSPLPKSCQNCRYLERYEMIRRIVNRVMDTPTQSEKRRIRCVRYSNWTER